jgi:hypothetical protein
VTYIGQEEALERQRHGDMIGEPIRTAADFPEIVRPIRVHHADRQIIDRYLDWRLRPFRVEFGNDRRGIVLDDLERCRLFLADLSFGVDSPLLGKQLICPMLISGPM